MNTQDIRGMRQAAGLTQEQAARLADVTVAYLRSIEHGYRPAGRRPSPVYERLIQTLTKASGTSPEGGR